LISLFVNLGTIGAEVRGIDLARVTATEVQAIKQAWYSHDVLLFPGTAAH